MSVVAFVSLFLSVALLLVPGGAFVAPFVFGLFLLAVVGALAGAKDRTARQHNPAMNPRGWRDGS